jgi:Putative bacterial sensory transduction regulator
MRHPKTFFRPAALTALTALLTAGSAGAQDYSQRQLQDIVSRHLAAESLRPEVTSAGNVRFRSQGRTYVIHVDERDPLYFRLTMAFVADDKSEAARRRLLDACNTATAEVKVIKCFLDEEGDPTFAAEMFLVVPGDFTLAFDRLLRAMDSAYRRYSRQLGEAR